MFQELRDAGFDIVTQHHAEAILAHDMSASIFELTTALKNIATPIENLVRGKGGESDSTQRLRRTLDEFGWHKHNFLLETVVDGIPTESQRHRVDHVKWFGESAFALEIEWTYRERF